MRIAFLSLIILTLLSNEFSEMHLVIAVPFLKLNLLSVHELLTCVNIAANTKLN